MYTHSHTLAAGSQRIPMHHSCLKGTPSSSTMMTTVTTNTSLQRMQSVGTINAHSTLCTDTHLTGQAPLTTASANNNCHGTALPPPAAAALTSNGQGMILPKLTTDSLISGGTTTTTSNGARNIGGRIASNCPHSAHLIPSVTTSVAGSGLGSADSKQPPQPFIRWTTASARGTGASTGSESATGTLAAEVVGVPRSVS